MTPPEMPLKSRSLQALAINSDLISIRPLHQSLSLLEDKKPFEMNPNMILGIGCPHHPSTVLWYWVSRCKLCQNRMAGSAATPLIDPTSHMREQSADAPSISTPPTSRRDRRRYRAASKHPYTYPRKGSDTNPNSLTGRVLSIYREGLSTIGRTFTPAPTPWKC
jgi:hypothetical protein